ERIREELRTKASPRHVPDDVIAVPAIPHTRTGKKLEVPVKRLIQGHPLERVANPDAVDSFDTLTYFTRFARSSEASENRLLRPLRHAVLFTAGRPVVESIREVTPSAPQVSQASDTICPIRWPPGIRPPTIDPRCTVAAPPKTPAPPRWPRAEQGFGPAAMGLIQAPRKS